MTTMVQGTFQDSRLRCTSLQSILSASMGCSGAGNYNFDASLLESRLQSFVDCIAYDDINLVYRCEPSERHLADLAAVAEENHTVRYTDLCSFGFCLSKIRRGGTLAQR